MAVTPLHLNSPGNCKWKKGQNREKAIIKSQEMRKINKKQASPKRTFSRNFGSQEERSKGTNFSREFLFPFFFHVIEIRSVKRERNGNIFGLLMIVGV